MNILKFVLSLSGYSIGSAQKLIQQFELLSFEERQDFIGSSKHEILNYHFNYNDAYRKLLSHSLSSHWHELPVIKKNDFQSDISSLLSKPFKTKDVYISNTSGSSGHPFFFAKDKFSHALTWSFILTSYSRLGLEQGSIQARFYGIPLEGWHYYNEKIKDFFSGRIRFPVFDLGDDKLGEYYEIFSRKEIHYIYGYTNSILLFAQFLLRKGVVLRTICPSLQLCIVTSEVCVEEDKDILKKAFGVPVIREYGASELGVIAIEDHNGRWGINESSFFVEVLAEDNAVLPLGEEGRLVITSLYNKAMPFIRYDLGDVGVIDRDEKGLFLEKLLGRVNDTVILPSGKKSPGMTFYYVSRNILETLGIFKEFIVRQTALDSFEFDVIATEKFTATHIKEIQGILDKYLEPGLNLKINKVKKIERPPSGKIKHFYSNISSDPLQENCIRKK
jgi:phenylacetate-coenzyme A ligase PaaK-like adenylate-forming protein